MSKIDDTLAERGARYGAFRDHAIIAQDIKDAMWHRDGWTRLAPDQKQALEVIADKIARILNGDPNYVDNWHDIIGYARLVEDRLNEPKVVNINCDTRPFTSPEGLTLEEIIKMASAKPVARYPEVDMKGTAYRVGGGLTWNEANRGEAP